jgi:hypothetical protein
MKQKEQKSKEAGLFLPNRELSWVIALALVLSFLMFSFGYFWGQRRAVSQFLYKVKEESFADGITYSLYAMNPQEVTEEDSSHDGSELDEPEVIEDEAQESTPEQLVTTPLAAPASPQLVYVAPLVGFGTLHAANTFAQRVKKRDIPVIVKQRSSKTQRGRKIVWYQVVTQEYAEKSDLEKVIAQVQEKEKIKQVKIIEKKKG